MTGCRIKQIEEYIDTDSFFLTYGDGLSNVNINKELDFHNNHQKVATLVGVNPPSRFGELVIENDQVTEFIEKAQTSGTQGFINGGFYILRKEIFNYVDKKESCVFEKGPLEKLVENDQLQVFKHTGFWQCMDTYREFELLNSLVKESPWTNNE